MSMTEDLDSVSVQIARRDGNGPQFADIDIRRNDEGIWEVNTEELDGEGWRGFAGEMARPRDVKQLLRKEYDIRF